MKGKAQGKLYNKGCTDVAGLPLTPERILETFSTALACAPEKHGGEFLFEPHQKLVSSAIKFVLNTPPVIPSAPSDSGTGDQVQQLNQPLDPARACEIMKASFFTKRVDTPPATDRASFVAYAIEILRKMRSADKAKWHHRMTSRLAHLIFEELKDVALAKTEFSTLFQPKSCSVSIWKPEFERAGRHYFYASQYNLFYCTLLERTVDRASLELMAKKVRKNANGLFRHTDVWHAVFQAYMKVLRKTPPPVGPIPNCHEDEVFKTVSLDEFTIYSARLEAWAAALTPPTSTVTASTMTTNATASSVTPQPGTPGSTSTSVVSIPPDTKEKGTKTLDLLREVFELRKLNSALVKTAAIDDLLVDVYAKLYEEIVPSLKAAHEAEVQKQQNPMSLKNLLFDAPPLVEKDDSKIGVSGVAAAAVAGAGTGEETAATEGTKKRSVKVPRRELISKAAGICKEVGLQMGIRQEMIMQVGSTGPSSSIEPGTAGRLGPSTPMTGAAAGGNEVGGGGSSVVSSSGSEMGEDNGCEDDADRMQNTGLRRESAMGLSAEGGVEEEEGDSHMADGEDEDEGDEMEEDEGMEGVEEGEGEGEGEGEAEADGGSRMEVDE